MLQDHRKVQAQARTKASPDQVWALVRDFCAPWHPAIDWMTPETDGHGVLIRAFSAGGEATVYKERLTYFSESERTMTYTHLEGITGAKHYEGHLSVLPTQTGGAQIVMSATLSASLGRADEIATGTQTIFDVGVAALAALPPEPATENTPRKRLQRPSPTEVILDSQPRLALTVSKESATPTSEVLCLFLHGIGGNRRNWAAQLGAIKPLCPVAALDLRGYGDSALGPQQTTIEAYCDDILRVMQAMGAKRLILCGLSYGAWIATSFAMRHPEKLAALVVSGGCTGMSEAENPERDAFRKSREIPLQNGQTPADFAASVVAVIAGPEASNTVREALIASMQAIPSETYADALRCFTNPPERFDFAKLALPVLLMTGEHDRLAPPAEIKAVAQRISNASPRPDVRFEVIAGAGHVCNLEQPEQYNCILEEFIARVLT